MTKHSKDQPCLHCVIAAAIKGHAEAHGERDPASGMLVVNAEKACGALVEVLAEIVARAPDGETRGTLIDAIEATFFEAVAEHVEHGNFAEPKTLQ